MLASDERINRKKNGADIQKKAERGGGCADADEGCEQGKKSGGAAVLFSGASLSEEPGLFVSALFLKEPVASS